jgi:hypothetical protein
VFQGHRKVLKLGGDKPFIITKLRKLVLIINRILKVKKELLSKLGWDKSPGFYMFLYGAPVLQSGRWAGFRCLSNGYLWG